MIYNVSTLRESFEKGKYYRSEIVCNISVRKREPEFLRRTKKKRHV